MIRMFTATSRKEAVRGPHAVKAVSELGIDDLESLYRINAVIVDTAMASTVQSGDEQVQAIRYAVDILDQVYERASELADSENDEAMFARLDVLSMMAMEKADLGRMFAFGPGR